MLQSPVQCFASLNGNSEVWGEAGQKKPFEISQPRHECFQIPFFQAPYSDDKYQTEKMKTESHASLFVLEDFSQSCYQLLEKLEALGCVQLDPRSLDCARSDWFS